MSWGEWLPDCQRSSQGDWWPDWHWSSPGDWWCDPESGWRRGPEELAASIVDDDLKTDRVGAAVEHGGPSRLGAYVGGQRTGHPVANYHLPGQERGRSGSQQ